ncbi:MAG: hypothetical protein KJ579_02945 [Verrucomicrobia bacterium]|nr:hypothetical protein [Verrucomicrobiota bacterium]
MTLPPAVRELIGQGRLTDLAAIRAFLCSAPPDESLAPDMASAKDQVLKRLTELPEPPPGMLASLCGVLDDPSAEPIGRIYTAQYISLLYPRYAALKRTDELRRAGECLHAALGARDPVLVGTALLQLGELCGAYAELDPDRIAAGALVILRDAESKPPALVSAMQVCAKLRVASSLPLARHWLASNRSFPERASALRLLGEVGERADLDAFLAQRGKRDPLAIARQAAARRIEERLPRPVPSSEAP